MAEAVSEEGLISMASKYGFEDLNVGGSFEVSLENVKEKSFRVYASNVGKKLGKKFSVAKDKDKDCLVCTRVE